MSNEIKTVMSLLCKQLNVMLGTNLKPEHFRLAKFDKNQDDVVPLFWTTLSLLTTKQSQINIELVKDSMKSLNYTSELFYGLPEDFSSGSREILLAIAFVLAKNLPDMIKELVKHSPFELSNSLIDLDNTEVLTPEPPESLDESGMQNYVKWLKGKIHQNKKLDEEYKAHIIKIYEKLNSLLNNKATGKLSLNEVLALSSKKYSKEFVEKCSHVLDVMECYQDWTRKEKTFWKWMATVLSEREKE